MITREIIRKDLMVNDTDYEGLCLLINKHKHFFLSKGMEKGDSIALHMPPDGVAYIASYVACFELGLPMFIWDDFLWDITDEEYVHGGAEDFVQRSDRVILNTRDYTKRFNKNRHFIQHTITEKDINYEMFPYWRQMVDTLDEVTSLHEYNIDQMSDEDIRPWSVDENDVALILNTELDSDNPQFKEVTHKELMNGLRDFPKDEVFGFTFSLQHRNILQNALLPALMNSKRLVYLFTPSPGLYGKTMEVFIRRSIRSMRKYGINAMFSDGQDSMSNLFRLMGDDDFRETVRIMTTEKRGEFHDFWEAEKNIFFDFFT